MRTKQRRTWPATARIAISSLAGVALLVLLAPASGVDTLPPECRSMLGYGVPCGAELSVAVGAATAGLVGLALWFVSRRNKHQA